MTRQPDDSGLGRVVVKILTIVSMVGIGGGLMACGGGGDEEVGQALPACEAAEGILPHAFDVAGMAGDYTLRLYATHGDSAGRDVAGTLHLVLQADSLREYEMISGPVSTTMVTPLYGSADVKLSAVGAVTEGGLASTDPVKPGVAVIERHVDLGVELTLRFGSLSNMRGRTVFDGAYMALSAKWGGSDRFGGSWGSGVMASSTQGYFCADRVEESE